MSFASLEANVIHVCLYAEIVQQVSGCLLEKFKMFPWKKNQFNTIFNVNKLLHYYYQVFIMYITLLKVNDHKQKKKIVDHTKLVDINFPRRGTTGRGGVPDIYRLTPPRRSSTACGHDPGSLYGITTPGRLQRTAMFAADPPPHQQPWEAASLPQVARVERILSPVWYLDTLKKLFNKKKFNYKLNYGNHDKVKVSTKTSAIF